MEKTIDVLFVGFLFLRFPPVSEARLVCEAWVSHEKEISKGDRLELIQWLGISLVSFCYLIQGWIMNKTMYSKEVWLYCGLRKKLQNTSLLSLFGCEPFPFILLHHKISILHQISWFLACWIKGKLCRIIS